jgi:hypothetical protein
MDISLDRVLDAARARRATLTPEVAGYVMLLAAQQLAAERSQVSAQSVLLDETGDVLVKRASAASELDVEAMLRELLGALIAVCSSPPPAIVAVAERGASGDLRGLVAELSAALIPINHSAAHRALARLYREARRADGHVAELSRSPIAERSEQPKPLSTPEFAAAPGELDIDVVVEPEVAAEIAPDLLPRDLLAPDLPTRDPGLRHGSAAEPIISHVEGPPEPDEELRLVVPAAAPRWTEARSDVQQLLGAFLAETRSIEHMLRVLRDMIGLELRSRGEAPLDMASIAAASSERSGSVRDWPA